MGERIFAGRESGFWDFAGWRWFRAPEPWRHPAKQDLKKPACEN